MANTVASCLFAEGVGHREYRVPGFLCSRPNFLPPSPNPQVRVALPPLVPKRKRGDTLSRGRGRGGSPFGYRDIHSGTLGMVRMILAYK